MSTVVVWKFVLNHAGNNFCSLPADAQILTAGIQDGTMVFWVLMDTEAPRKERCLVVVNTGESMSVLPGVSLEYLATITSKTSIVWHIFEKHTARSVYGD